MSTTLKNILECYPGLEKEFCAIHKETAEYQTIWVEGKGEKPIVHDIFDITLEKHKVLVKPGSWLLQTSMLSFTMTGLCLSQWWGLFLATKSPIISFAGGR